MLQYSEDIDNKSLFEIVRRACNCVDTRLMDHGFRVAYIVSRILRAMNEKDELKIRDVCFLAMLHDVGAYKTEEISRMLEFDSKNVWAHSIYGCLFIKYFSPLRDLSEGILYHHMNWEELQKEPISDEMKDLAQMINIADRIDVVSVARRQNDWEFCARMLEKERGRKFAPWLVDLVTKHRINGPKEEEIISDEVFGSIVWGEQLTQKEITEYLEMLIYTIDFRSRHTVTHTMTTTSISYEISKKMNLDEKYCDQIVCGALLHDIGKIGVPVEILEFPGKLSPQAMKVMRGHVKIGEEILGDKIENTVQNIALRHHEKLDGSGYPLGLEGEDLTVGERIVAISDIVSALAGTRSYKEAYSKDRVENILTGLKKAKKVDAGIVDTMIENYDEIMEATQIRCQPILDSYQNVHKEYDRLMKWSAETEAQ